MENHRLHLWPRNVDLSAQYPGAGAVFGLFLVGLLVPILSFWHGVRGPLGLSIPLFFLVPVLLSSAVGGRRAGVVVSIVAVAIWDWYFIPPLYRVTIYSARDVLALVVFLLVAVARAERRDEP